MQMIGQYPIQETDLTPYCGRNVAGMTLEDDFFFARLDHVADGRAYFRPMEATGAAVANIKQQLMKLPEFKYSNQHIILQKPVRTSAFWGPWAWGWWWPLWFMPFMWLWPFFWW